MKVGMIFECGPQGADRKVCVRLAKTLDANLRIVVRAAGSKPNLIYDCGVLAGQLIDSGCDRVMIIWDLYPAWTSGRPCMKADRQAIFASLLAEGVDPKKVDLVCIENELETWLMTDIRGVSEVIRSKNRNATVRIPPKLQLEQNPKAILDKLFRELAGIRYNDLVHAERIAIALADIDSSLGRLRRKSESFRRFAEKAAGVDL